SVEVPGIVPAADGEVMLVRDHVIEFQRVLTEVRMRGLGPDPIGGSLLEPGYRERKDVQESLPVVADLGGWNDVAGKGRSGRRVIDNAHLREKGIGGAQQLAEVAVP